MLQRTLVAIGIILATASRLEVTSIHHEGALVLLPLRADRHAREERRQLVKLVSIPPIKRVIVALRALDLDSQQDA